MSLTHRISLSITIAITLACFAYVTWYNQQRQALIARTTHCQDQFAHPETAPQMRAPDGSMVAVMTPCLIEVVPPSILDLVRGRMVFTGVPDHMQVAPYSQTDVFLGRYSLTIDLSLPCDQSATTTDCGMLTAE